MKLTRPLVFVDLETTGPDPVADRIVQFACVKLMPDGERREWSTYVNPTIPIPTAATDVHRITDSLVKDAPTFHALQGKIWAGLKGCDIAGYNVARFDLPCLVAEFERCKSRVDFDRIRIVDAFRVFQHFDPRDLAAAVKKYAPNEVGFDAHSAIEDIRVTVAVVDGQVRAHPELNGGDVDELDRISRGDRVDLMGKLVHDQDGDVCVSFGKNAGKKLSFLAAQERSYLYFMLNGDFPADTKRIVRSFLPPPKENTDGKK